MKKTTIESPLHYYERNPLIIIGFWLLAAALLYWVYDSIFNKNDLRDIHPLSFFSVVPASIVLFQALWFTVNPYALIYKDRFEVKRSIFDSKEWYFLDLKKIGELKKNGFSVVYNDDEAERIRLLGIRKSHLGNLYTKLSSSISDSLSARSKH